MNPHRYVCAVGRTLRVGPNWKARPEEGRLDWQTKCPMTPNEWLIIDGVETWFCRPHFVGVTKRLDEAEERLQQRE